MKNTRAIRALLSTSAQYFTKNKEKYPGALDRIGKRIGSKLSIAHEISRNIVGQNQDTWGRVISSRILPLLGIEKSSYGISSNSGRMIVKIPKLWETEDPAMALPVVTSVIERMFSGWYVPIETEVNLDRSILLAVTPLNK